MTKTERQVYGVYYTLLIGMVLGILLPLWTLVFASGEFTGGILFSGGKSWYSLYRGYIVQNIILLVSFLVFRKVIFSKIEKWTAWARVEHEEKSRRLVLVLVLFSIFTFLTRLNVGFWHPGIAGWDEENKKSRLKKEIKINGGEIPDYLSRGLFLENGKYFEQPGFIQGRARFLHFGSQVLPYNDGIFRVPFPAYIYKGWRKSKESRKEFFALLRYGLRSSIKDRSFFMGGWKYPDHNIYQKIEYGSYPDSELLSGVSSWKIWVQVGGMRPGKIVEAEREYFVEEN